MLEPVRLDEHHRVEWAKALLKRTKPVLLEFTSQGTRFALFVSSAKAVEHLGIAPGYGGDPAEVYYVGLMESGGLYPFQLGCINAGYLQTKLKLRNSADARNITVLLNALGHPDGVQSYLATIPLDGDHVDHSAEDLRV